MSQNERMLPHSVRATYGAILREIRNDHRLSQYALAKLAGVGRNSVDRIEKADHVGEETRDKVFRAMIAYHRFFAAYTEPN